MEGISSEESNEVDKESLKKLDDIVRKGMEDDK